MTRSPRWLVTLPVVLAAIESGHALGNLVAGAPRSELFASPGSGLGALPLVGLVLASLVAAGVAARATSAGGRPRATALPFALLPPAGFVLLELGESLSEPGRLRLGGPAFVLGLLFQLPAAVIGYLVARALLRLGDEARILLLGFPRSPLALVESPGRLAPVDELLVALRPADRLRGRAPPALAAFPG
jgi:hypothetical protein